MKATTEKAFESYIQETMEQRGWKVGSVAAFLDRETAKLDALSAKIETAIEKLKEYRTALISAAVTGKIDVREAV